MSRLNNRLSFAVLVLTDLIDSPCEQAVITDCIVNVISKDDTK